MRRWIASFLAGIWPVLAYSGGGQIEIDQICALTTGCLAGDAPGFPVDVVESGSYVLTSELAHDLTLHGDTEIVRLLADDIVLDLNGFTIRSTSTCDSETCTIGSVDGIDSSSADRVTIRNGRIVGVNGNCIRVANEALIEDVAVSHCGNLGISVGANSIVRSCRVTSTGRTGLHVGAPFQPPGTIYRDCTFAQNGLRGEEILPDMSASVARSARAAGPTSCEDGLCGNGQRRYYLSTTLHNGSQALSACDPGFHMASIAELLDLSQLSYDSRRGVTQEDSGSGPPGAEAGFVRTGQFSQSGEVSPVAGDVNCGIWTSDGSNDPTHGTEMELDSLLAPTLSIRPCQNATPVWCIEE